MMVGLARAYFGLGKFVEAKETYARVINEKLGLGPIIEEAGSHLDIPVRLLEGGSAQARIDGGWKSLEKREEMYAAIAALGESRSAPGAEAPKA